VPGSGKTKNISTPYKFPLFPRGFLFPVNRQPGSFCNLQVSLPLMSITLYTGSWRWSASRFAAAPFALKAYTVFSVLAALFGLLLAVGLAADILHNN
jgi:hypothetical protein